MRYEISKLLSDISMGPFGSNIKTDCYTEYGVPYLNGSNLTGYKLNETQFKYVTEEKADSLGRCVAHRGDIIVTHRGTLGQMSFIPEDSKFKRYVTGNSQFRFTCNKDIVLPEYLVYYFHSPIGQHKLLSNASQVGVPSLARPTSSFQKLEIDIPPIEEQKKIVAIISALEEKIELNTAINENLEQQAQALFEDYLCKVNKDTVTIGDVIIQSNTGADAIQKAPIVEDNTGIRCVRVGDLSNGRPFYEWGYTKVTDDVFKQYQLHKNDIIVTRTATLGLNAIIHEDLSAVYNNGLIRIVVNSDNVIPLFLYRQMQTKDFFEYISMITGETSVRPNMKINYLLKYSFRLPSIEDQKVIINLLKPMFLKQQSLTTENKNLSLLRDTLLPKLMNGEIDMSEVKI